MNSTGHAPRFTVVVPHYQGSVPHERFERGVNSLLAQDFPAEQVEILCFHDGPLLDRSVRFPVAVEETPRRAADFGHSLRDLGMRRARGSYIVHFNPDNVLYPHALSTLASSDAPIIVFPVVMRGLEQWRRWFRRPVYYYSEPRDYSKSVILRGRPVRMGNIDCMQWVMLRELWLREGGWHDRRECSDGFLYQDFATRHRVRHLDCAPLGEHW